MEATNVANTASNSGPNTTVANTASNSEPNTTAIVVAGVVVLTIAGCLIIPPLLKKCSNKAYKLSIKKDEIDFDNLGPEIIRKKSNDAEMEESKWRLSIPIRLHRMPSTQ